MKITILTPAILILYFNFIKLTSDNNQTPVVTSESVKTTKKLLTFSFKKKNFKDFICYFDNDKLSNLSLKTPPFYYSKPVRNFFSTFCLLFQYSLIKNNEDFRRINENLFKLHLEKIHKLKHGQNDFVYEPQSFIDHLERLKEYINTILLGKNSRFVSVKERAGRIYITQNDSTDDFTVKLVENCTEIAFDDSQNKEIIATMIEFYTAFNEFNLQELFKGQVVDILTELRDEYRKRKNGNYESLKVCNESFEILMKLYAQLSLLIDDDDYFNVDFDVRDKVEKKSDEYTDLFAKMYCSGVFSCYFNSLVQKARSKVFYDLFKYPGRIFDHAFDNDKHKTNVLNFIKITEEALKDSKIVRYTNIDLNEESFENLLKNCLELAL